MQLNQSQNQTAKQLPSLPVLMAQSVGVADSAARLRNLIDGFGARLFKMGPSVFAPAPTAEPGSLAPTEEIECTLKAAFASLHAAEDRLLILANILLGEGLGDSSPPRYLSEQKALAR